MYNLTSALELEAARILNAATSYDYRQRTRLERALYSLTSEFTRLMTGYELGGLTEPHAIRFRAEAKAHHWSPAIADLVEMAFSCHRTLLSLAPTDPSSRGNESIAVDSDKLALAHRLSREFSQLSKNMADTARRGVAVSRGADPINGGVRESELK